MVVLKIGKSDANRSHTHGASVLGSSETIVPLEMMPVNHNVAQTFEADSVDSHIPYAKDYSPPYHMGLDALPKEVYLESRSYRNSDDQV